MAFFSNQEKGHLYKSIPRSSFCAQKLERGNQLSILCLSFCLPQLSRRNQLSIDLIGLIYRYISNQPIIE
ncbi:MAG: hypothetical protein DRR16_15385 [Candidatus Parabeggiatoa sp. nov. 3]|nr:MAG: hypothetical protein DRR00_20645 [Gammaproteobacteria bacterium]RKZ60177.1 MAG: hypothetical protein DRQ99_22495 [Gammaproteobacteria bacterium]RKZ84191.1 MAG: hypothetical protein DRR16_15385 [Gammaproteobacteria bacterium]